MPAGLPGTGVGGLFLVISALLMPLVELGRRVRGRSGLGRWRLVGRHTALAVGMVAVVVGPIGALYGALLRSSPVHGGATVRSVGPSLHDGPIVLPVAPVLLTLMLLGGIIVIAYTLRLILHGSRTRRDTGTPEPDCDSASEEWDSSRV
jgi:hypothetical protein